MRIRIMFLSTAVEAPRPALRPPLTVDGLGTTRTEGLARLREAIERRTMEGDSLGQAFQPDGPESSGWNA
jgi:hypothetical protein